MRPILRRVIVLQGMALAAAVLLLAATACGDGTDAAPSADTGPRTAPEERTAPPSSPVPATSTPTSAVDAAAETAITLVARDNAFDRTLLRVPAGDQVRLTLVNEGIALHDWQVLGATNPSGGKIATPLLTAGTSASVTFVIATPGEYAFFCEVHPVEMRGRLFVE